MLGLPGNPPRPGSKFRSPFRPDEHPSCDISKDGRWFADRSRGDNLDAVGFVREAIRGDWSDVRAWFLERMGIDMGDRKPIVMKPEPVKKIQWPADLIEATQETWTAFDRKLHLPSGTSFVAVHAGILRFLKVDGVRCYAITDNANRAAEIRRCDGGLFGGRKAYPLRGVDKSWLPGASMLEGVDMDKGLIITEGPRDLLAALGLCVKYKRSGKPNTWSPAALLGAGCKKLHPGVVPLVRGRRVRLVPDGDEAGDRMAANWREILLGMGCTVDVVRMPSGKDLSDVASEIEPEELFE